MGIISYVVLHVVCGKGKEGETAAVRGCAMSSSSIFSFNFNTHFKACFRLRRQAFACVSRQKYVIIVLLTADETSC